MTDMDSRPVSQTVVYAQDTEPTDTRDGIMWVDTASSENDLYTYSADAADWVLAAPSNISVQDAAPSAASLGDGWIDTGASPPEFKVYDGAQFSRIGATETQTTGITGGYDSTLSDRTNYGNNFSQGETTTLTCYPGNYSAMDGLRANWQEYENSAGKIAADWIEVYNDSTDEQLYQETNPAGAPIEIPTEELTGQYRMTVQITNNTDITTDNCFVEGTPHQVVLPTHTHQL